MIIARTLLRMGLTFAFSAAAGATVAAHLQFPALDMDKVAAEDAATLDKEHPTRFAVAREIRIAPGTAGAWHHFPDGRSTWLLKIGTPDAVHLNFGFTRFSLPSSASLTIHSAEAQAQLGPFTASSSNNGQLWTPVLAGHSAVIELEIDTKQIELVELDLTRVGQGYRGFGFAAAHCKSGACNMDVACLASDDAWNQNRRAAAAITVGGTDTCSGTLLNNTLGDRRLLFATASHCRITAANVASVLAYFNYESPTCRTPGSTESGAPSQPKPNSTLAGLRFLAATNAISGTTAAASTRSDWTLIELAPRPEQSTYNLFWSGWDRRPPPTTCTAPVNFAATTDLCASIHHPAVDEKRITFVETAMTLSDYPGSATGVHWRADWDPTPPILGNLPAPRPTSLPPGVTEPGSSGSALFNAERRLIGVLSGGPSACGATGASLADYYGGLFHAWDGLGTEATRMRDHLDPSGSAVFMLDGVGQCDPPATPIGVMAAADGANRILVRWDPVAGAERYRVSRTLGACPGTGNPLVAESTTGSYSDTQVSGGTTYAYRVSAFDDQGQCESARSACVDAAATGACATPPTFAGLVSTQSADTPACAIQLSWPTAVGNCGSTSQPRFNVYRSTASGFSPASTNRIGACLSATNFADSTVAASTRYFYIVRAEDLGVSSSNGACGGAEETNLVQRDAVATGPSALAFADDAESGNERWLAEGSGGGANWSIVTTQSRSPSRAWFVPDPNVQSSRTLSSASAVMVPVGSTVRLEFFHRYDTESRFDGGVLEYSLDGGTTWSDILAAQGTVSANASRMLQGSYNATLSSTAALGARAAWHGSFNTVWIQTVVDLADFSGRSLRFRFRFASDSSIAGGGWWVDDIRVFSGSTCQAVASERIFRDGFE